MAVTHTFTTYIYYIQPAVNGCNTLACRGDTQGESVGNLEDNYENKTKKKSIIFFVLLLLGPRERLRRRAVVWVAHGVLLREHVEAQIRAKVAGLLPRHRHRTAVRVRQKGDPPLHCVEILRPKDAP